MSDERAEHAAKILDDWATAIRGNWGGIDGRTCRMELNEISAYLRGEKETLTLQDVGVCKLGEWGPHWDEGRFSGMHEGVECNQGVGERDT